MFSHSSLLPPPDPSHPTIRLIPLKPNLQTPHLGALMMYAHQAASDDTGNWQRDDPAHVDPRNHPPVDAPPGAAAQADADGGAGDALGGADGQRPASRPR